MNRLFRVSFDILITSIVPIASWALLGLILDSNLINVFTLTYPLQFVLYVLRAVFSTGANICSYKEKNKNIINSGIILGTLFGAVILGIVVCNIEKYISFMNMDISTYKVFAIYSIIQIYMQLVLHLILDKLYYREENKKANKISLIFNLLNFTTLILSAIVTKNQVLTSCITLIFLGIYTLIILITNLDKFKLYINIFKCIKYDSVTFFTRITFVMIYLFGLSNAFSFGTEYVAAISFATLVTDMQWDIINSIAIVAKIDIAKKKFDYNEHVKNAYFLDFLLIISSLIMILILFKGYNVDMKIAGVFIGIEYLTLIMYPLYAIKTCYLQLEYSTMKTTVNKQIADILRTLASAFLATPYCTLIRTTYINGLSINLYQNFME